MNKEYLVYGALLAVFTAAIITSVVISNRTSESYKKCICSSHYGRERDCQSVLDSDNDYFNGSATEFSKFKPRGWDRVSPGDIDFPQSSGCSWGSDGESPQWQAWDYDQLSD